jgi:hypothetical protein
MKLTASFGVKFGAAFEPDELLAQHAEFDGQLVTLLASGVVRRSDAAVDDLTVGEDGGVRTSPRPRLGP